MSKAFKCDRCDAFFDVGGMRFKVHETGKYDCWSTFNADEMTQMPEPENPIAFDLCPECAKRVMRFVKPERPGLWADGEEYAVTDDLS